MGILDFDTPPGASSSSGPSDTPPSDLTCETCGVGLYYAGRGRKPRFCEDHKTSSSKASGSTTGTKRGKVSDQELNDAVSNLSDLYDLIGLPLSIVSPPAAQMWEFQVQGNAELEFTGLNDRNRRYLANNKKLVQRINQRGDQGSTIAFVGAQIFAIAPVMLILYGTMTQSRAQRAQQRAASAPPPSPHYDYDADPVDIDQEVFGNAPPPPPTTDAGGAPDLDDMVFGR